MFSVDRISDRRTTPKRGHSSVQSARVILTALLNGGSERGALTSGSIARASVNFKTSAVAGAGTARPVNAPPGGGARFSSFRATSTSAASLPGPPLGAEADGHAGAGGSRLHADQLAVFQRDAASGNGVHIFTVESNFRETRWRSRTREHFREALRGSKAIHGIDVIRFLYETVQRWIIVGLSPKRASD